MDSCAIRWWIRLKWNTKMLLLFSSTFNFHFNVNDWNQMEFDFSLMFNGIFDAKWEFCIAQLTLTNTFGYIWRNRHFMKAFVGKQTALIISILDANFWEREIISHHNFCQPVIKLILNHSANKTTAFFSLSMQLTKFSLFLQFVQFVTLKCDNWIPSSLTQTFK